MTKTPNCSLNQWDPEDPIRRTDFNEDNAKLDAALDSKAEASTVKALQTTVAGKANASIVSALQTTVAGKFGVDNMPWIVGTYTGAGYSDSGTQEIVLGFKPKLLIIVGGNGFGAAISLDADNSSGISIVAATTSTNSSISGKELTLTSSGFQVIRNSLYGPTINQGGLKYIYFALR